MATGSMVTTHPFPSPSPSCFPAYLNSHVPISFTPATTRNYRLFSSPSSVNSSSAPLPPASIFLSFLEQEEEEEEEEEEKEREAERGEIGESQDDPIYSFFRSRTSTKDPGRESKLTFKRNRRLSWKFAGESDSSEEQVLDDAQSTLKTLENKKQHQRLGQLGSDGDAIKGVVREILEAARNLPHNTTLGEQLDAFQGRLRGEECVEALEVMAREDLLVSCLYLFEWMRMQEPSLLTPRACSVLFPLLGKAGMGEKVLIMWRNLPVGRRFGRDVHVFNAALSGLLYSGRFDDAWEVYNSMESNNVLPDRVTGSVMITIMRKQGKSAKEAWEFFERMNRKGVQWSVEVLGALIKSFCEEGLQKQAIILQAEMEKKGISSNVIIYNTLMDAYCKSNGLEEAEGLYTEMKIKGLSPTVATFNILMDAYSKRMQPDIVENLLKEMQDVGLEPNVKSYTSLISAYGRQGNMSDMAANAFLRMRKVGIKPTSHSYTALIHAYSISGWHEKAYKAFDNMVREGIKPSIETYTALLDAYRRAGDTKMLMAIWKSMIHEKIEGTRVTFNILVDGFAKQGQYVEARDVISEFGKIGLQPTLMTYNMLMNAYARGGQHSKLPHLLKEMSALGLKPDSVTYSTMIYAYVRVRDFKRAFIYHKQMVQNGQVPDANSYEKLRAILDEKAAVKNKKDRKAIMGIVNSKAGLLRAKKTGKNNEFWKTAKDKRQRYLGSS
ncbi:hypothetical protein V2J09_015027 [Rumex salicifolius]